MLALQKECIDVLRVLGGITGNKKPEKFYGIYRMVLCYHPQTGGDVVWFRLRDDGTVWMHMVEHGEYSEDRDPCVNPELMTEENSVIYPSLGTFVAHMTFHQLDYTSIHEHSFESMGVVYPEA